MVEPKRPDVVLMDIRLPGMDGIEATRRITASAEAPKVLVLTSYDLDDHVVRALRAGATGFLLKDEDPQTLAAAAHTAARGDMPIAARVAHRMADEFLQRRAGGTDPPSSTSCRTGNATSCSKSRAGAHQRGDRWPAVDGGWSPRPLVSSEERQCRPRSRPVRRTPSGVQREVRGRCWP